MRKAFWVAIWAFFAFGLPGIARCDGGFVSQKEAPISMPYQRGFVSYQNGVETLIVESTLNAPSGEYGWLIPTPSTPSKVESCQPGVLEHMVEVTNPKILGPDTSLWSTVAIGGGCVLLLMFFLFVLNIKSRISVASAIGAALVWSMMVVFAGGFVHVLTLTKGVSADGLVLRSEGIAGSYAYFNLSTTRPDALIKWLDANGFILPSNAESAIEQYVKRGWSITALKYRHNLTGTFAPHPIQLTFATKEPVYPMALTGTVTPSLKLDLVVAMEGRSDIFGFEPIKVKPASDYRYSGLGVEVPNPSTITRFRMDLTRSQMKEDFLIKPSLRSNDMAQTWYSHGGARYYIFKWSWYAVLIGVIWTTLLTLIKTAETRTIGRNVGVVLIGLAMIMGLVYLRMHQVDAVPSGDHSYGSVWELRQRLADFCF